MSIQKLKTDKAIQSLLGPESFIGDTRVILAEKPFVTIQGEGPNTGKNTLFIRFFGCNLANSCGVDWCDSNHSFFTNEEGNGSPKPDRRIYDNVDSFYEHVFELSNLSEFNNIVFTGGEPLLWQHTIAEIIQKLKSVYKRNVTVEIETNGTIGIETDLIDWFRVVHFNISPKVHVVKSFMLLNQLLGSRHINDAESKFIQFSHSDWIVKFVWEGKKSEKLLNECMEKYNIPKQHIYLMPEGITTVKQMETMKELAEYCINNGYNFSPRLHVLIWDKRRGI